MGESNNNNNNKNENIEEAVSIVAKNLQIFDYETTYDIGSIKGDNYLGVITVVDVKGKTKDGKYYDFKFQIYRLQLSICFI